MKPPDHFIRQKVQITRTQRVSTKKETGPVDSWRAGKSVSWKIAPNRHNGFKPSRAVSGEEGRQDFLSLPSRVSPGRTILRAKDRSVVPLGLST
jgi:hypothetical protein